MTNCPVSQAEIDNDSSLTFEQERQLHAAERALWKYLRDQLLNGETVSHNNKSVNLAERLADQHEMFACMVNCDYDYMAEFIAGKFTGTLAPMNEIFKSEAGILASILVG